MHKEHFWLFQDLYNQNDPKCYDSTWQLDQNITFHKEIDNIHAHTMNW